MMKLVLRAESDQSTEPMLQVVRADGSTQETDCLTVSLAGSQVKITAPFFHIYDNSVYLAPTALKLGSESMVRWSGHYVGTAATDVALSRKAENVLEVNTGTAGEYADLTLRTLCVTKNSEPADAELAANQVMFWFEGTNGNAKMKFKGKTDDGTVVAGDVALT